MGKISESSMDHLFSGLPKATRTARTEQSSHQPQSTGDTTPTTSVPVSKKKKTQFLGMFNPELLAKARILASNNSLKVSDILNYALQQVIKQYEKTHGEVVDTKQRTLSELFS